MKWIETADENFVNLEKVAKLEIRQVGVGEYNVIAVFPVACGADNLLMEELLATYEFYSDAKFYLDELLKG